jgi:hypothetical protein
LLAVVHGLGPDRDAGGDAVEPGGQRRPVADRRRPAEQDEERGLEGVVGVGGVAEHPPADAEHHRPVPADEHLERGPVAGGEEPAQQLRVG